MFANEEFIEASRKFVCIRIETYESKKSEQMVRQLLNGRFANTAFCVFDPQGQQALSRSGRGPHELARGQGQAKDDDVINEMNRIAARYRPTDNAAEAVLQDFNSFRQALNVASADQRLLIFLNSEDEQLQKNLVKALAADELIGRFHVDIADAKTDKGWNRKVKGAMNKPGMMVIRSDKFGLAGEVLQQLPESASTEQIMSTLQESNEFFASKESRKSYSQHVTEGRRKGVYFENEIPYGEDRDGDGKPDREMRQGQRGRR